MTDPAGAGPYDTFWSDRQAHKVSVAEAFNAVQLVIAEGEDAGLYVDGLPPVLSDARNIARYQVSLLDPQAPVMPGPFAPPILP